MGLIPVQEYQNDLLYSKSWGYNPFALEGFHRFGDLKLHYFAANLSEGTETNSTDDKIHYQTDISYALTPRSKIFLTSSYLDLFKSKQRGHHLNDALKVHIKTKSKSSYTLTAMLSKSDKALLATNEDASGQAFRLEYTKAFKRVDIGLLATSASGKSDGSGFLVPMSFTKTTSYWGYSGIVTVCAETDTGFDSDSVHISNNGYGMNTVQMKAEYRSSKTHSHYLSAGWFGGSKASNRESNIARELFFMDKLKLNKYLSLHMGFAYAKIYDSLSGYGLGAAGGFNQAQGVVRYKRALYGRLQVEF